MKILTNGLVQAALILSSFNILSLIFNHIVKKRKYLNISMKQGRLRWRIISIKHRMKEKNHLMPYIHI
jgi:hypothetical protein